MGKRYTKYNQPDIYNQEIELLASSSRTATTTTADQENFSARGLHLVIDVTAIGTAPSITPTIEAKDPVSGKYYTLLTGPALTATGTTVLKLYPGLVSQANAVANDVLPGQWRVSVSHANADTITYSVGANLVT